MSLKVALLGGGSWGTTIASIIAKSCPTTLWARDPKTVENINQFHVNKKYLPEVQLNKNLVASASLEETLKNADVIVSAVPSQNCRSVLENAKPFISPQIPIISLAKGLELNTHKRITEVISEILPGHPVGVLTGPNLAKEIIAGQPAGAVLAMDDENLAESLQQIFGSNMFRVYTNNDVIGCELGGALKNVIAIAVGMGDGLKLGDNTRSMIITRGLAELTRLGVAMGGKSATFAGLAGMGDLIATCTSKLSRNRYVGIQLGEGRKISEIISEMSMIAEGVKTSGVVVELAEIYNIEMPISQEVYKVVTGLATPKEAFRELLKTKTGAEWEPG